LFDYDSFLIIPDNRESLAITVDLTLFFFILLFTLSAINVKLIQINILFTRFLILNEKF